MAATFRRWLCFLFIVLCGFFDEVSAEVFTAMADVENLLYMEKHLVSVIDQYIHGEIKRLERLRDFAKEYKLKNQQVSKPGIEYISNPINVYVLIKRLTSDWSYVENLIRNTMAEDYLKNITSQRHSALVKFPDSDDLEGSAAALMRLQATYKLDTHDLAQGRVQGVQGTASLDANDCFQIGRIAYNRRDYYHTLSWMEEAQTRMLLEDPPTVQEVEILEYLAFAMYQQGNLKRALGLTKRLYKLQPDHPRAEASIKYYEDELVAEGFKKDDNGESPPVMNQRKESRNITEHDIYEALCRSEQLQSNFDMSKLYCHFKRDTPFLKIAPLRVEILHWRPKIVLFRGALSDAEIKVVTDLAASRLKRAKAEADDKRGFTAVDFRIAKSAWLKDHDHPTIARISKRIADMTGLAMTTAEFLQIANYGIGGHYEPHYDMSTDGGIDPYADGSGNRIATVLAYLSQPDAGGATVFPRLKLTLYPSKNDAVFWFNVLPNGQPDLNTRHAACPVLAGVKWVSNKWIHERDQEFKRHCSLDKNEYE